MRHYISGKGNTMRVDTRKIITGNPEVFDELLKQISLPAANRSSKQELKFSQVLLSDPNHRYALGSFSISVQYEGEIIELKVLSNYHYGHDNNRITRYIHQWMHDLKERGIASDFEIEGDTWTLAFSEFISTVIDKRLREYAKFDRLYM